MGLGEILGERRSYAVSSFQYGTTPLVWACRRGHKEIADMLLSENATVDNAGMVGKTAMYISVVSCQFIDGIKFTFITEKHREYQSAEESGNNQDVKQVMHWKLTRNTQVLSG